jgi:hypothetical protein
MTGTPLRREGVNAGWYKTCNDLSKLVAGLAFVVSNTPGTGFLENVFTPKVAATEPDRTKAPPRAGLQA